MSSGPPGGYGTMKRIGLACAEAGLTAPSTAAPIVPRALRRLKVLSRESLDPGRIARRGRINEAPSCVQRARHQNFGSGALSLSLGLQRILRRPSERSLMSRMSPSSAALCRSTEMRTVCNSRKTGLQTMSVPLIQS